MVQEIEVFAEKVNGVWRASYRDAITSIQVESKKYSQLSDRIGSALEENSIQVSKNSKLVIRTDYTAAKLGVDQATLEAEKAAKVAYELRRSLVRKMRADGLTQEDVAAILNISHQRVSQLAAD